MTNNFDIITFVINLKTSTERKKHMNTICSNYRIKPFFFDAVNGQDIHPQELSIIYSRNEAIKSIGRELSLNEIGCALSHKLIYQKIINENIQYSLILEDDVFFGKDLISILEKINEFPDDLELALLGHHPEGSRNEPTQKSYWGSQKINSKHSLARLTELGCGTYGYLISNTGANKLLSELDLIRMPIDHLTGNDSGINVYGIFPPVIKIHEFYSDKFATINDRKIEQKKARDKRSKANKTTPLKLFFLCENIIIFINFLISRYNKFKLIKKFHK